MKYLITGCNGQLGYDIVRELLRRGETDFLPLGREEMDITNREQVMNVVESFNPDVIFHCAAYTAVDAAEKDQKNAHLVNAIGTKNLTDASIKIGAKIIYTSTDYVFDGQKEGLYNENDLPAPMSIYGLTKYLGEEEVKRNPNHFIARISWVFGINGNNFIRTMLNCSEKYKELTVVDDQIGSPTYTVDLSKVLVDMAKSNKYGIYNVTNEGFCSWAEFAEYIFEVNNKDVKVNKVSTEEYFKGKEHAPRPMNSKLSKEKLSNNFSILPDWKKACEAYSKELKLKL